MSDINGMLNNSDTVGTYIDDFHHLTKYYDSFNLIFHRL